MKKLSLFTKIYISVVSCFVILLIAAAVLLWSVLGAYEETRPKYVAEDIFNRYCATLDFGGLLHACGSDAAVFDPAEGINDRAAELFDASSFTWFSVTPERENTARYAVTSDNKRVAYFTLEKSEETGRYGFKYYRLSEAELFFGTKSITVRAPEGYSVMLNGNTVDEKYITAKGVEDDRNRYLPEGVKGIYYNDYKIDGLFSEPEVTVVDASGNTAEVVFDESQKMYLSPLTDTAQFADGEKQYIIDAMSAYTAYMSNDAGFDAVARYLDKSAELYGRIRSVETVWVREHSGYRISNVNITELYRYSDDVMSCRVTLKEILTRPGYTDYVENIDVTLYLKKSSGKYLIYEIITNS